MDALHGWFGPFESVDTVFLADVTEVKTLPDEGVLAHFRVYPDYRDASIFMSLPGVPQKFCLSYRYSGDPAPRENDPHSWSERPFADFGE